MGFTDSPNDRLTKDDREYIEEIVKSGKKTTYR
jgi:hypothetical protein